MSAENFEDDGFPFMKLVMSIYLNWFAEKVLWFRAIQIWLTQKGALARTTYSEVRVAMPINDLNTTWVCLMTVIFGGSKGIVEAHR